MLCWLVNIYRILGVARSCYQQGPAVQLYTARPWRWRQHTLPQCQYLFTSQHITHLRRLGSQNHLFVCIGNRTGNNKCSATFTVQKSNNIQCTSSKTCVCETAGVLYIYILRSAISYRIVSYHITFIFIPLIRTGLQNPYGYGNSELCFRNLEMKSIQKCTIILFTGSGGVFEVLT